MLITPKDFSEQTGYKLWTVHDYIRRNKIPAINPTPDRYLINDEIVNEWRERYIKNKK